MTRDEFRRKLEASEQADRDNAARIFEKNWGKLRERMELVWRKLGQMAQALG